MRSSLVCMKQDSIRQDSQAGVAFYDKVNTVWQNNVSPNTDWVVMCGTNAGSQLSEAGERSQRWHRSGRHWRCVAVRQRWKSPYREVGLCDRRGGRMAAWPDERRNVPRLRPPHEPHGLSPLRTISYVGGCCADKALRQRNARKKAELGSEAIIAPNTTSSFRRRRAELTHGLCVDGKGRKGGIGKALGVRMAEADCLWSTLPSLGFAKPLG